LSIDLPGLALAFSAGVLTLFSPCSFPLLPGYVLYYLGSGTSPRRYLSAGFACTSGILAVFSAIGLAASALRLITFQHASFLGFVASLIVISMGIGMVAGLKLPPLFVLARAPKRRDLAGAFLYGVAYGLAASGCSAPIFLSMIIYATMTGGALGPFYGAVVFLVYALGMALPMAAITAFVAKAKGFVLSKLVKTTPWLQRASGLLLIAIGAYILCSYLSL
jgi:cytochrome c-type biogenesis protein